MKRLLPIVALLLVVPGLSFAQSSDHGESVHLGSVSILGEDYSITRLGKLAPGKEAAFEVESDADVSGVSTYLWVESEDGARVSAPSKGILEKGKLHFHVVPKAGSEPQGIVLRVRGGGKDERASLSLDEHGHEQESASDGDEVAHPHAHGHNGHGHTH